MLTSQQRDFFSQHGYVVLRRVFSVGECTVFGEICDRMKQSSEYVRQDLDGQSVLYGAAWFDRRVLNAAMDDRLRSRAEDLIGCESRLEENEFIIFHASRDDPLNSEAGSPGVWHRGLSPAYGSFESQDRYYSLLTKAIIFIDEPECRTGTWVLPGSHRIPGSARHIVKKQLSLRPLQVSACQGDVLLFGETLVHSSPTKRLKRDRRILVIGYCPPFMRPWGQESDPPECIRGSLNGSERRFVFGDLRYDCFRTEEL